MLTLNQVKYLYPASNRGFTNLNLTVPAHHFCALIGPNGAGKSTLLHLMGRLKRPQAGQVAWHKRDLWQQAAGQVAQQIAVVLQQNEVSETMAVREVLQLARAPYQHSLLAPLPELMPDQLAAAGVAQSWLDRSLAELSGGQQQRVWLAAALVQEPELLLLDEPMTYLDLHQQRTWLHQLQQLSQQQLTVVAIMHDLNQVWRYCDMCVVVDDFHVVATGAPQAVLTPQLLHQVFGLEAEVVATKFGKYLVYE